MKTFVAVFFILFFFSGAHTQPIAWNKDRLLTWEDFKAKPTGKMFEAAKSTFEIKFKYQGAYKENELVFEFEVNPVFLPEDSWYNHERATNELLNHEQLHFDITELFARKMRKRLRGAAYSQDNYDSEIKALYKKTITELNNYRSVYNSETFFGAKPDKQQIWNDKVATALQELSAHIK